LEKWRAGFGAILAVAGTALLSSPASGVSTCSSASCGACTPPSGFGISTLVDSADLPAGGASAFTAYVDPDDGTDRRFLVTQEGVIWTYRVASDQVLTTPFLDISANVLFPGANGESGLVSMAVSPDYATNGEFYVYYSQDMPSSGDDDHMRIERYTRSANPDVANTTPTLILVIEHPATNHNGGTLAFGPDGFLYVSTGDGGGSCDSQGPNAQRNDRLQGKILRLDVADVDPSATAPDDCARGGAAGAGDYEVPSGNPFTGAGPNCNEIWAVGLRNPFRMSFDRDTGDIFYGDVGQGEWEEINFLRSDIAAPQNFGWKCREGCQTSTCGNNANDFCPDTLTPGVTSCAYGADIDTTGNKFLV
jgi:glucose/arabinose dehydrogenase